MKHLGIAAIALLFASGCAHHVKVNSAHLEESGTHVVSTPGALTIARQSANATHVCTLRTAGPHKGKHHKGAGKGGPPGDGPGPVLDVILFRLCEARANNDISPEQYAASVQMILKTMSEMAMRPPPAPPPGMGGPWGMPRGMWGRGGRGMGRPDFDGSERGGPDRDGDADAPGRDRRDGPGHFKGPGPGAPPAPGVPPRKDDKPKDK